MKYFAAVFVIAMVAFGQGSFSFAEAGTAPPKLKLLVLTWDDKTYAGRIENFLKSEWFDCDIVEYTKVTKAQCDAHDMIVVDSPNTNMTVWTDILKRYQGAMANFPETDRPIFATGFLGTELYKAKKVSLACGYI